MPRWFLGAALLVGSLHLPGRAHAVCYMAFIHGYSVNATGWSQTSLETLWSTGSGMTSPNSFTYAASGATSSPCVYTRVGYNGNDYWKNGAVSVAQQLVTFINAHGIPDNQLILVGKSMGGLVGRHILNQGVPGAPYYSASFNTVMRKSRYLISDETPHMGAEGADALYGTSESTVGNLAGYVLQALQLAQANGATASLRRGYMESCSASGGWCADAGRTKRIYTIAGYDARAAYGGLNTQWDQYFDASWGALCHHAHAVNGYGAFCIGLPPAVSGDGIVEQQSAFGQNCRGGSAYIQGPRTDWRRVQHNHRSASYNDKAATIKSYMPGSSPPWYTWGVLKLGTHVGGWGRALPG